MVCHGPYDLSVLCPFTQPALSSAAFLRRGLGLSKDQGFRFFQHCRLDLTHLRIGQGASRKGVLLKPRFCTCIGTNNLTILAPVLVLLQRRMKIHSTSKRNLIVLFFLAYHLQSAICFSQTLYHVLTGSRRGNTQDAKILDSVLKISRPQHNF